MKIPLISLTLPALCLLLACGGSRKIVQEQHIEMDPIVVTAKDDPRDIYRTSDTRAWDILHTRVALSFNLPERTANGRAWLRLHPYFYPSDTLVLDAKTMRIDSIVLTQSNTPLRFQQQEESVKIFLNKTYQRWDTIEIYIRYLSHPYTATSGGSAAIRDDRGLYFINTNNEVPGKPVQIWTQGETEANSHWLPTLDQPNERMTVELALTVPDSFTTLSNGAKVDSRLEGNGLRTDIWRMDKPIQPYAIMMAIGKFAVVEDKPWNGKEVSYYVEPEYAKYASQMFKNTPEMMEYFSGITGVPYPWNKYSQVVVRDYVSGAMENTTASLFGEFMYQNFREIADKDYEDVVSHELFHQWFGDYVTTESWTHLTVNESFANYGEQLWRNYKYGKVSRDELALYDLNLYLNQTKQNDEALVRHHYHSHEDMFDRISYQKGGSILGYMHGLMGDSAFFKAMNLYLTRNALQPVEATHWRLAVEEVTGQDWNWFFNQWYLRGGHPQLNVYYNYDDNQKLVTVDVQQIATDSLEPYRLPMQAALITETQTQIIDWLVDKKRQSYTFPYPQGQRPVFVPDIHHWLPGRVREQKDPGDWLLQLRKTTDYISKHRAVGQAFGNQKDSIAQVIFHTALRDSIGSIRAYAANLIGSAKEPAFKDIYRDAIQAMAASDIDHRARAAAFDALGKWKLAEAKPLMLAGTKDLSYMVSGAALRALSRVDQDSAYVQARLIMKDEPKAALESAAWEIIAKEGSPGDIAIFEDIAPRVYGTRKVALAGYLYDYIVHVPDTAAADRAFRLLQNLATTESIKPYRFGIGSMIFALTRKLKEEGSGEKDDQRREALKAKQRLAERYSSEILRLETDPGNLKKYKSFGKGGGAEW